MAISCAVRTFLVTALAVVFLTGVSVAESPQSASSLPVTTASDEDQDALDLLEEAIARNLQLAADAAR